MIPTFKPGDHVLTFNWVLPKKGDVVVFVDSHSSSLRGVERRSNLNQTIKRLLRFARNDMEWERVYFIKRVKKIEGDLIYIEGDNVKNSASFGSIAKKQIRGRVILKY